MSGKLKVIVQTEDDARIEMFILSSDTSIRRVMNLWKTSTAETRNFRLSTDGYLLDANQLLNSVEGVHRNILSLTAQYEFNLNFKIYKSRLPPQTLSVLTASTPRQLKNSLQKQFSIDCDRLFRLRTMQKVLDDDLALREQGVEEGDTIQIDLSYIVTLDDTWKYESLTYELFSSDSLTDFFPINRHLRVYAGGRRVDLSGEFADIGGFDTYPYDLCLQWECKQNVYVMNAGNIRSIPMWPSDIMKDSSNSSTLPIRSLINGMDGRTLASCTHPDSLLHPPPLSVIAHVNGNYRKILRVPRYGIIADLRHSVEKVLKLESFQILVRGQWLYDDSAFLSDVGITENTEVDVKVGKTLISISINGKSIFRHSINARVRFSELVEICERNWENEKELWKGNFVCKGCGRRLSVEEEDYQTVPSQCCSVQSLELEFSSTVRCCDTSVQTIHPSMVEAMTQTSTTNPPPVPRRNKKIEHTDIPDFKAAESMTVSAQTEDWIQDSTGEFSMRLTLPYLGSFWYSVRPDETLRDIANNLRRAGKIVIVSKMSNNQETLSTDAGWLNKTAVECKLDVIRELYVDVDFLHEILVNVRGPIDREGCYYTIPMEVGNCTVRDLVSELKRYPHYEYDDESTLILQCSCFYKTSSDKLRRAFDSFTGDVRIVDEEDGRIVSIDEFTRFSQLIEFLSAETGIKAAHQTSPVITISLKNVIWRLGEPPTYNFIETNKESIHDINYVAQIEFLRLRNTISATTYLFIELAMGYGDCNTGCFAGDNEAIVAESQRLVPKNRQKWNRCILLLKEGDLLPRVHLPHNATVAVFVRGNTQLKVINDKIALITLPNLNTSNSWVFTRGGKNKEQFSEFEKSVSDSLRR